MCVCACVWCVCVCVCVHVRGIEWHGAMCVCACVYGVCVCVCVCMYVELSGVVLFCTHERERTSFRVNVRGARM